MATFAQTKDIATGSVHFITLKSALFDLIYISFRHRGYLVSKMLESHDRDVGCPP